MATATDLHHAEDVQELITLIRENPALTGFRDTFASSAAIGEFANRARFYVYEQGSQFIRQGESGRGFYIVMRGQVRAVDVSSDEPRLLSYFTTGDIVGERSLLSNTVRTATIEVVTQNAKVAFLDKEDWEWLTSNPQFITYFKELERSRLKQSAVKFSGKQWDEVVVDSTKRHVLAFLSTLPLPLTILIAPIAILIIADLLGIGFVEAMSDVIVALTIIPLVLIAVILMLYNYFDWRNDDFIVTTKRVIHIERYLFFAETRRDAPLTRIQDVTIVSGILDVMFDSDNLRITTAGAGVIEFNNARRANAIRQTIFRERERAKARVAAADTAALRENIASELDWSDRIETNVMAVAESEGTILHQPKTRHYNRFVDYFVPRPKEVNESEAGTMIVWRKHFFILLLHIFLPVLAMFTSAYLLLSSFLLWLPPFGAIVAWPVQLALFAALIGSIFWYVWQYDDWNKDVYIVTDTQIIDIEASSFRLTKTRREGTFDNIQGVYSEVPNVLSKILGMGNVIIETAGTQDTFTFNSVFDPDSVTSEIFNRWALYQQREREKSRDSTTSQVLSVLKEYHRMATKQAEQAEQSKQA